MQYKNWTINVKDDPEIDNLNLFLRQSRIISVTKNLIQIDKDYFWNFLIETVVEDKKSVDNQNSYKKPKVDYKEILTPEEFTIFSKLRDIRKEIAEKNGIPVYNVFTNEHLAEIAKNKLDTKSDFLKIQGIGEAKINNYADKFIEFMKTIKNEKSE